MVSVFDERMMGENTSASHLLSLMPMMRAGYSITQETTRNNKREEERK
jgi:hypothetical protein